MPKSLVSLKMEADKLNIEYPKDIRAKELSKMIEETHKNTATEEKPVAKSPKTELTPFENAMRLVRVIVTPNSATAKQKEGELIQVGNSAVPVTAVYVPFNTENGTHIPNIVYQTMKHKKTRQERIKKGKQGEIDTVESYEIPAYNIVELPMLTEKELEELKHTQANYKAE